jgi:RNA-directed DNA polymerase
MWIHEDNIVEVPFDKEHLLEQILNPENLNRAYKCVMRNKGCGGIDKMSCEQLLPWLLANKELLISSLLDGSYRPNPVRRLEIPQWQETPIRNIYGGRPIGATSHQPNTDATL